jgi:lincosamide nucleotidyltransferase A/C/D/E
VTEILDRLAARDIEVWVDGGWASTPCSASRPEPKRSRPGDHPRRLFRRTGRARPALGLEYAAATEPGLPARLTLRGAGDRLVDLHPLVFDDAGNGWQELPDGKPGAHLAHHTGTGSRAARHGAHSMRDRVGSVGA